MEVGVLGQVGPSTVIPTSPTQTKLKHGLATTPNPLMAAPPVRDLPPHTDHAVSHTTSKYIS